MKRPAVFMDRDGTISEEVGYVDSPARFHLYPFSAQAIRKLNENDLLSIVITNQSGVARGYFSEDMITTIHCEMEDRLRQQGARLDAIYYCAHHPTLGAA